MNSCRIEEVNSAADWESFYPLMEKGIFLQSWNSKRHFESLGHKTWAIRLVQNGSVVAQALVILITAKRGTFLYLPYGPILATWTLEVLKPLADHLIQLAKANSACFIRFTPYVEDTEEHADLFTSIGCAEAPIHLLAETPWILDLKNKTEDSLLSAMEKKHRNLIRRAEKEGVIIVQFGGENCHCEDAEQRESGRSNLPEKSHKQCLEEPLEQFWALYSETFHRHKFTPYPKESLINQVRIFEKDHQAVLMSAIHNGQTIASGIFMYYGKGGFYHHGASSSNPENRKIPASYLLQWSAIKEAQRRNCDFYSFWGIAPFTWTETGERIYPNPSHPFVGITHFKTGFGGRRLDLLPCRDLIVSKKYWLNWMVETARKWRRGF